MLDTGRMRRLASSPARAGILLAAAAACALVSNSLAAPARHLGWGERPVAAQPAPALQPVPAPAVQPVPVPATIPSPPPIVPVQPAPKPAVLAKPAPPDHFAADPAQPIREISSEDAWALFQAKAPFLDARRSAQYEEGHIAGAWNASVWEATLETRITEFEAGAHPVSTTPLVLYCDGGSCEDSHLLASRLTTLGYRNLLVYRAGYPDWAGLGRPTGKGARP